MTQSLSLIALKVETASLVAVVDRSTAIIIAVISQVRDGGLQFNTSHFWILYFDVIPNSVSIGGMILVLVAGVLQSAWKYYKEARAKL